jgi:hypothetical protein
LLHRVPLQVQRFARPLAIDLDKRFGVTLLDAGGSRVGGLEDRITFFDCGP